MLSFDDILKKLSPFATSSWTKRFMEVRNRGAKMWLLVVRDFDVQSPEVEYVVNDIVRELEVLQPHKSLVRAEMEKLEHEGKLKMDTPEEEAYWEERLEAERQKYNSWKKDENMTYLKQKKLDLEFLRKKRESENNPAIPMAHSEQDARKNAELNPAPALPSVPAPEAPAEPMAEPVPQSDAEKEQAAFVPKPPRETEAPVGPPKMKAIAVDGEEVYNAEKKAEPKKKVEQIEGMPADAAERLKKIGVSTEESFKQMDRAQAKQILGGPLYSRLEKMITS